MPADLGQRGSERPPALTGRCWRAADVCDQVGRDAASLSSRAAPRSSADRGRRHCRGAARSPVGAWLSATAAACARSGSACALATTPTSRECAADSTAACTRCCTASPPALDLRPSAVLLLLLLQLCGRPPRSRTKLLLLLLPLLLLQPPARSTPAVDGTMSCSGTTGGVGWRVFAAMDLPCAWPPRMPSILPRNHGVKAATRRVGAEHGRSDARTPMAAAAQLTAALLLSVMPHAPLLLLLPPRALCGPAACKPALAAAAAAAAAASNGLGGALGRVRLCTGRARWGLLAAAKPVAACILCPRLRTLLASALCPCSTGGHTPQLACTPAAPASSPGTPTPVP